VAPPPAQATVEASRRTAIVTAVERLAPAVVSISVAARQQVAMRSSWADMFVPRYASQLVRGSGTGFLIRSNGVILTNQHVAAPRNTVTLRDGTQLSARLVGADPSRYRRHPGDGAPPTVPLGKSELMVGEWSWPRQPPRRLPGNTEPTVTAGVVSATGRNILPSEGQAGLYLDMIQTDAAINPGNSGGPLANALGQVVGVNSSILSNSGGSIGLGFAIPIERALRVADLLLPPAPCAAPGPAGRAPEFRGLARVQRAVGPAWRRGPPRAPASSAVTLVSANGRTCTTTSTGNRSS
jgi:serine protease Do